MTGNDGQDAIIEREAIYRKYIEGALRVIQERHLSFETGWIHVSSLSYIIPTHRVQVAPLEENIQYCLLLLRSKTLENINHAKDHLVRCLQYQNRDGSFPQHALELVPPADWTASFRLLFAFEQIIEDFSTVLGHEIILLVTSAYISLREWCYKICYQENGSLPKVPYYLLLVYLLSGLTKNNLDENQIQKIRDCLNHIYVQIDNYDLKVWGIIVALIIYKKEALFEEKSIRVLVNQLMKLFFSWWSSSLEYIGPSFSSQQLADERGVTSFHIALSLLSEKKVDLKIEKWPYEAYFSLGFLYSTAKICFFDFDSLKNVATSSPQNEKWGIIPLSDSICVSYCIESLRHRNPLRGFSPCMVIANSWSLFVKSAEFNLTHVQINNENQKIIQFHFLRNNSCQSENSSDQPSRKSSDAQVICELYVEKKEGIGFKPFLGAKASRFSLKDSILVGQNSDINTQNAVKVTCEFPCDAQGENVSGLFHAQLRVANRPGQIIQLPPHLPKRAIQGFVESFDWLLSIESHSKRCLEASAFTLSVTLA